MPIQNKDLGKYDRPDIFIVETNTSQIELPIQNTLINFVPGVSKKGPVNNPIYIESKSEFISIFGDIDKGLERKGSYFHRTCLKMLESGPIYALNLLLTDDERDKAHWKSLSCAAHIDNNDIKQMPYSRLFNRQDFWERDSESFLEYINDPVVDYDRLLHLTNFGNKITTTFIYKSKISGFDITAEDWYGGKTKVPTYINPKDWISDYLVSVLILDGDWTKYDELSEDKTWGKYFSKTGLNKTTIQDFVNETNVTTLGYYDASLIPYFKDINGRDMYIKNLINNDTNKTGLFCAYFEDELLDSDFPIGKVDLIGDSLVNSDKNEIDFLSYNESIIENLTYKKQELDDFGNVFGNYNSALSYEFVSGRTAQYTNGYVSGTKYNTSHQTLLKINNITNNKFITVIDLSSSLSINDAITFSNSFDTLIENKIYYVHSIDTSGFTISETRGGTIFNISNGTLTNMYVQSTSVSFSLTNSKFIIDNAEYSIVSASTPIHVNLASFDYNKQTGSTLLNYDRYDILYLSKGNNAEVKVITGTQSKTKNAQKPPFILNMNENIILGYVYISHSGTSSGVPETEIKKVIDYTPVSIDTNGYVLLTDAYIITGSTQNNYLQLVFEHTSGGTDYSNYKQLRYRSAYNEIESKLSDGKGLIINHKNASKFHITQFNMSSVDYNSMSNAYIKIVVDTIDPKEFYDTDKYKWLIHFIDNEFILNNSNNNRMITSTLHVNDLVGHGQISTTTNAGVIGKYSNIYLDYYNGILNNGDFAYLNNDSATTQKILIKAWIQDVDKLYIDFMNIDNTSPYSIQNFNTSYNNMLIFISTNSNFKQTVEIEEFNINEFPYNVYTFKVDANRYSELIKGEMIEAYYDNTKLNINEDPRKLTRIINVVGDPNNTNLKIITCDSPIKINAYEKIGGGYDYQTITYPTIEKYVSDYKGIKLTPFTISNESIPNGTEERQSDILDLLLPTTNLGQGLVNKNKIQWRYLIDSFGLGLTSKSKNQYSKLLGKKLNSFGFISAPSVKTLKASVNPSFINDDHTLNTEYLKNGGNEYKNPAFLYSFADDIGSSTIGYFFPYIKVNTDGIPTNVPPAAWVATTYMKKFLTTSSAIQPWTIAAGISNGRVTDIGGVEMDFSDDDLSNLYSMGLNPIVKRKNTSYCINSESTAQIFPYSSLSMIHSREVLIELENALYDMLLRYQWKFNTGLVRAEIKYKADKICQNILNKDGLYDFENIIDETNNTNYIIDLQMGVLDTRVEIVKGMGIIVNNITILKKGDIQSGGFKA